MSKIENVILFQIDKTSKIAKNHSQAELDKLKLGITVEQWIILKIIEESKELSQKEIAEKSFRDKSSITRTLDILYKKQLISRETDSNNRRQQIISLTKQGVKFVQDNMSTIEGLRKKSVGNFTHDQLKTLSFLLEKIQKNMS